jgi:ABC-type nitrate/sulfonate/bicarbonate transport system permease component
MVQLLVLGAVLALPVAVFTILQVRGRLTGFGLDIGAALTYDLQSIAIGAVIGLPVAVAFGRAAWLRFKKPKSGPPPN